MSAERYEHFDSHYLPSITSCAPQMFGHRRSRGNALGPKFWAMAETIRH